jgi:hypothetical protein
MFRDESTDQGLLPMSICHRLNQTHRDTATPSLLRLLALTPGRASRVVRTAQDLKVA